MNTISTRLPHVFLIVLVFFFPCNRYYGVHTDNQPETFLHCLSSTTSLPSNSIFTSDVASFYNVLQFSARNQRFDMSTTPKPLVIIQPSGITQIGPVVVCAKSNGLQLRVRSGGHDYEGLSYVSSLPFVVIDLINLAAVAVDTTTKTVSVQSGATIGQVYYHVGKSSNKLAFPAGICPGYGTLLRYAGLAADHVTDVSVIDPNGQIRNRQSLGEDVFWAIRGGGGNTFGIVAAWKVSLVTVLETVTVTSVSKFIEQDGTHCLLKWQQRKNFKGKTDYVTTPISEFGLKGIWERMLHEEIESAYLIFTPYGGMMARIPETSIPFPHRQGNLFKIQYLVYWTQDGEEESNKHINWMRELYTFMTAFVSNNPRAAYVNYRDIDIGANNPDGKTTTYQQARVWGIKYFKGNFDRLVKIKTAYDPTNVFNNEQSIPSLPKNKSGAGEGHIYYWSYCLVIFGVLVSILI
ncbi:Berberine bridge enzyme-like 18 [Linum perenne]